MLTLVHVNTLLPLHFTDYIYQTHDYITYSYPLSSLSSCLSSLKNLPFHPLPSSPIMHAFTLLSLHFRDYILHYSHLTTFTVSKELWAASKISDFFFLIRRKYSWCRSLSSKIPVLSSRLCSPTLSPTNSTENQLSVTLYRCSILQMLRKWWKDKK